MSDDVFLVPHTHWDREWYEPFQRFRLRLVDLMDDVIARAQRDPGFRFTLDGQMAVVQDYLEVRPGQRSAIRELVGRGQLAVGPWRVLLDEFLCSGENIVRNLELGWSAASELGEPMGVGYLPDMFGHCAQMPQILALAGIRHACVWRGVPGSVDRHAFLWRSPDGTGLRTEYLPTGYGNAADLFDVSSAGRDEGERDRLLRERLSARVGEWATWFGADPYLAMYGTDHAAPLPTLMQQVSTLSRGDARMRVCTLGDYVLARDPDEVGLPVVDGELRSHARANILPGVISVRWQLKEAMGRAERMVERYAEPWAALWSPEWPQAYLDLAWSRLVDSSCHDSVTGCGVDETALQVAARIAEGEHAGQAVRDRAVDVLAGMAPRGSVVVVNPTPAARTGLIELEVPVHNVPDPDETSFDATVPDEAVLGARLDSDEAGLGLRLPDGTHVAAQVVGRNDRLLSDEQVDATAVAALFRRVHDRELFGQQITHIDLNPVARTLTFHVASDAGPAPFDAIAEQQRAAVAAAQSPGVWRVRTYDEERHRVVAMVPVPALGWTAVTPAPARGWTAVTPVTGDSPVTGESKVTGESAVSEGDRTTHDPAAGPDGGVVFTGDAKPVLDNGLVRISVRPDGALRLESRDGTVLDGVGRLVDGGDCGDSYNYGPPRADLLVDEPAVVSVSVLEQGPVRGVLEIDRRYAWPARLAADGSRLALLEPVVVRTRVELLRGEPFARLHLTWENRSSDHRLRLHVPLGRPSTTSNAEGQFAVVARGMRPEAGTAGEYPIPTYPASGFVDAGGAGVLLTRATEYELLEDGQLALTILRAIGMLSRNVHPYRDEPAGPQLETPTAQCLGPAEVSLAVMPHTGSWHDADLVAAAERYRHPLVHRPGTGTHTSTNISTGTGTGADTSTGTGADASTNASTGGDALTRAGEGLSVRGRGVAMTSLRRRGDWLELRLVAETPTETTALVGGAGAPVTAARLCDLLGREGETVPVRDGVLSLPMRAWQIRTIQLRLDCDDGTASN
jgi:mannosylglycerate hydrolase